MLDQNAKYCDNSIKNFGIRVTKYDHFSPEVFMFENEYLAVVIPIIFAAFEFVPDRIITIS